MGAHLGEHHSFTSHRTFKVAISLQQKGKKKRSKHYRRHDTHNLELFAEVMCSIACKAKHIHYLVNGSSILEHVAADIEF